jgi:transcription elongation GreA/GreB family factor
MTLKQKVHQHYLQMVYDTIRLLQQDLADLKESGTNETKSTAGDKHETALAMLQIEQANKRVQLEKVIAQKTVLEKINPTIVVPIVVSGSLVKTDKGYLFLSIASGKAVVEEITVTALSPQSPLGNQLMGLKATDTAVFNNKSYYIETIE